jgi:hypothetical protein
VTRYASAALVAALLVATASAFVVTENLKLTRSPVLGTSVTKEFSPVCDCETDRAIIRFRLRKPDRVSVEIVDGGDVVRELVREQPERGRVEVTWDGRGDDGEVVGEGAYRPRVRLVDSRRTITLPNPIRVDTTAPVLSLRSLKPRVFSPDGDHRRDRTIARYRVDEPASAILYVDGDRHTVQRGKRTEGRLDWDGRIGAEPVAPGAYALAFSARDVAGNLARRTRPLTVVVRYVALGRDRVVTVAGGRFAVLVASDAERVEWRLGQRRGDARPGTLRLRAPLLPGRYTLVVSANGFEARAAVFVRAPLTEAVP